MQLPICLGLFVALCSPSASALAQDDELPPWLREDNDESASVEEEVPSDPLRLAFTLGGGTSLRLTVSDYYQQQTFAPAYTELGAGVVLPGSGSVRHYLGLGLTSNLTGDGGVSQGLDPFEQLVLTPTYGLRLAYSGAVPDWTLTFRISAPFTLTGTMNPGVELGVQGAYMFLAGLGVFAQVSGSLYVGGPSSSSDYSLHTFVSAGAGILLEYEVLP